MKVLFVNPATRADRRQPHGRPKGSDIFRYPKLGILSIAAVTPSDIETEFVDEIIESVDYGSDADIIAISAATALAPRAYEIAREFRKRGKAVVMGGMHATFLPDECLQHVDAVVMGQGEAAWQKLLHDYRRGDLQRTYAVTLDPRQPLLLPPANRVPEGRAGYATGHVLGATRGCPYNCQFCSVRCFHQGAFHKRPIADVVAEVRQLPYRIINLVDDNIFGDPIYAKELFTRLAPLNKHILFQASINITKDRSLMRAIERAGGKGVFIGIESVDHENLRDVRKFQNLVLEYEEVIATFHRHGIVVEAGIMVGFDHDTTETFARIDEFLSKVSMDLIQVAIVTPMPGTPLYAKMEQEGRIIDRRWEHYDCKHVVFSPKRLTKRQLEQGADWLRSRFYSYPSILKRGMRNAPQLGIVGTLGYFLRGNLGFRKNYKLRLDYPP